MLKPRVLILLGMCCASSAQAGLFSDEEARKSIQQIETRVQALEDQGKQQTQTILDLQGQVESLNGTIRQLRGQNEEISHGLQDAEKREKDFYVDLDTRLRHFESQEAQAKTTEAAQAADPDDPAAEDRAIEKAYALVKSGNNTDAAKALQDFLDKYPNSVHAGYALYWLGNAELGMKGYKSALVAYRELIKSHPRSDKAPDAMLNIAICQHSLKAVTQARETLKQLISKYPDSPAAASAKKLLAESR